MTGGNHDTSGLPVQLSGPKSGQQPDTEDDRIQQGPAKCNASSTSPIDIRRKDFTNALSRNCVDQG